MSDTLKINTATNSFVLNVKKNTDPYDHYGPREWVDKQIEWSKQSQPSGEGLVDVISKLSGDLIGAEIGVCLGSTTETFLKQIKNIKKIHAIDNYPSYIDRDGETIHSVFSKERQELMKQYAYDRLSVFGDRIEFHYVSSSEFAENCDKKEFLDFVFIDGDHSEEGAYRDFSNFYPLVKRGGIFAGHDIHLPAVKNALQKFLKEDVLKVVFVSNTSWYLIKE